jgi:biopolymer transport protein ExbB
MDTFTHLNTVNGYATPGDVAHGVYTSLVNAALGLVVAIPSYLFYAFLSAKSRHLMNDLERAGIEIVNLIEDNRDPQATATSAETAPAAEMIVDFRDAAADASRRRGRNA